MNDKPFPIYPNTPRVAYLRARGRAVTEREAHQERLKFPCRVGTFSWYVGIGEGLGASPDGRLAGQPVSSNLLRSS